MINILGNQCPELIIPEFLTHLFDIIDKKEEEFDFTTLKNILIFLV